MERGEAGEHELQRCGYGSDGYGERAGRAEKRGMQRSTGRRRKGMI